MIFSAILLSIVSLSFSKEYYVAITGNDNNVGTEIEPFKTVQKGVNSAGVGDTVFIKSGTYKMSGLSKNILQPLTIIGESRETVVLDDMGRFNLSNSFTLKNIKFTNYKGSLFNLSVSGEKTIDGVFVENCIFDRVVLEKKTRIFLGRYDLSPSSIIKNINITDCDFMGLKAPGVAGIYIMEGLISNINIINNNFYNFISSSDKGGASAITIGSNKTESTTKDVLISGNFIDTIVGGTVSSDGENFPETHGIIGYGTNVRIIYNTVRYLNFGTDHEGMYMKANHSEMSNNVMLECSSHQGAIAIKGHPESMNNVVSNNRVQSMNQAGRSIYITGGTHAVVKNNYVKVPTGTNGIFLWEAGGTSVSIEGNYLETKTSCALSLRHATGSKIIDNHFISYAGEPIILGDGTPATTLSGNKVHKGVPKNSPVAIASANITNGKIPFAISFTGSASNDPNGSIVSYEWDFHDGTTSTDQNPTHTYTVQRTYAATLIVTDKDGFKDMSYVIINAKGYDNAVSISNSTSNSNEKKSCLFINRVTRNSFSISVPIKGVYTVSLFSINGKLVKKYDSRELYIGKNNYNWNLKNLGKNTYLLKVEGMGMSMVKSVL